MSNYICDISCSYRQPSGYCGRTGGYETCQYRQLYSKQTNADRIRSMTDEELAELLHSQFVFANSYLPSEWWLEWLQAESGEV